MHWSYLADAFTAFSAASSRSSAVIRVIPLSCKTNINNANEAQVFFGHPCTAFAHTEYTIISSSDLQNPLSLVHVGAF